MSNFFYRAGFANISKYPACLSVYAHQFGFPLVFVGLFSAYLLKKHWSTVIENFNGVHNWGRKIDLNFPTEKDHISQVQQPLQGKIIIDFEVTFICNKALKLSNTCSLLELHVNELLKYQLPRSRRTKSTNQAMEQTLDITGKYP